MTAGGAYPGSASLFDLQRADGLNESERALTRLCQQSFLRLWSLNGVYTNEGFREGRGSTKELCDALVVFGDDVLIFSDKHITFQADRPIEVAWPRWYRRAVVDSVKQLLGARSFAQRFPERVFMDPACSRPLAIALPPGASARYHLIAVTRGSREAVSRTGEGEGLASLGLDTGLQGDEHFGAPFRIGRPAPSGPFVHVFDEATVELLMRELDTAPDFIAYLHERERFLGRPGAVVAARGEEDLLALYLQTMDAMGSRHLFFDPASGAPVPDRLELSTELFAQLQAHPAYRRKREADRISYEWDHLVDSFIRLAMTEGVGDLPAPERAAAEQGLRLLAGEGRFRRRLLAGTLRGAMEKVGTGQNISRIVYSGMRGETVFVFLVQSKSAEETYEAYRAYRMSRLHAYVRLAKLQAPLGTTFVGIAFDHRHRDYEGASEDLFVYAQPSWSREEIRELERMRDELGILGPNLRLGRVRDDEFPQADLVIYLDDNSEIDVVRRRPAAKDSRDKKKRLKKMQKQSRKRNR